LLAPDTAFRQIDAVQGYASTMTIGWLCRDNRYEQSLFAS
jgi:hypothetical protein